MPADGLTVAGDCQNVLWLSSNDGGGTVWGSNESQVFAGLRIPPEVLFDNAGVFNPGSFVLTIIDGDEIAKGHYTERVE